MVEQLAQHAADAGCPTGPIVRPGEDGDEEPTTRDGDRPPWIGESLSARTSAGRQTLATAVGHGLEQVDDPRPPPRGDVVVELDDAAVRHRGEHVPTRASRDGRRVLAAALRVGEEDQVGVLVDDVLRRELRVAAR